MDNEGRYGRYGHIPIPSYEEALSANTATSQNHTGPEEASDDAERQGLLDRLSRNSRQHGEYRAPTVESARASTDSDLHLPEVTGEQEAETLRRDMEEMDIMDADFPSLGLRSKFSKRISYFTHSLSTLRISSFRLIPEAWSCPIPRLPEGRRVSLSIVARLFGLAILALLIYLLFALNIIPAQNHMLQHYDPESVRVRVQAEANADRISQYLHYITSYDHVAGTEGDLFLAKWMLEKWDADLLDEASMEELYVYLNYPTAGGRAVSIVDPPEAKWTALLEEENVFQFTGEAKQQTFNWHGSSKTGDATGHLVYANGGSEADFRLLSEMGADLEGAIALVRSHHTEDDMSMKVKNAHAWGAVGCLIYSDPREDGFERGTVIPAGPWRPKDSVQRGSVGLRSFVLGDYLTPGWASTIDAKRVSEHDNPGLLGIPSLALSWRDAQKLLQTIEGKGFALASKTELAGWQGAVPDVKQWWTGAKDSPRVLIRNQQDENKMQQIWNVRGLIQGVETPKKRVLVGNHRDAWCFGAVSPGSGSAVMMEVVNIFSTLRRLGWRPLRSIEFVSWDAGEYNLVGSTEFVEGHTDYLRQHAIAYLNVDAGVAGSDFRAAASPILEKVLRHALDRVADPITNKTLQALWEQRVSPLEGLGAASDFAAFQHIAGTSSIDIGFTGPKHGYPAGSCYETFDWMQKFGDAGFNYHKILAQVWALMILDIADSPIVPFDLVAYSKAIKSHVIKLDEDNAEKKMGLDITKLHEAADMLTHNAVEFHKFEELWTTQVLGRGGFETDAIADQRMQYNDRLTAFETDLLDLPGLFPGDDKEEHGLPGRQQYKHIMFGPQTSSAAEVSYFPAIRQEAAEHGEGAAQTDVDKVARILSRAASRLLRD